MKPGYREIQAELIEGNLCLPKGLDGLPPGASSRDHGQHGWHPGRFGMVWLRGSHYAYVGPGGTPSGISRLFDVLGHVELS